ncbi:MAG TPA: glycosyltransferase [Anaerolineae bacterium]|nr:glycosyltransferase [Anaerolineae bacterium]
MKICIMTFGTRGDVQPYVALGRGLQAAGYEVTIATLAEFRSLVIDYGLQHDVLRGDFLKAAQAAEQQSAAGKRGNPLKLFRQYIQMARDTLADEWASAQKAEVLIYNSAALGGYHIAEKMGIPAFASFPAPLYSPTREFPSPFLPFRNLGPFNKLSHRLFAAMGPAMYRRPIRDWRRDVLGLPSAKGEDRLRGKPVTTLYAYSEAVLPRPADWDESSVVTGYWFLDAPHDWQPDPALVKFLQSGSPPVYVGFGSMFMQGGVRKTEIILKALRLAGRRGVVATGWGGLSASITSDGIFVLDAAPHDWLFPQVAAVVHHGGAGTTGAALQAGKPTVVCPLVGDQPFWGRRLDALGVGPSPLSRRQFTAEKLAEAIARAVTDQGIRQRAAALGAIIRAEDGVGNAVALINRQVSSQ